MVGQPKPERIIGRYALYDQIGAGGMAVVHYGRLIGPAGFSKTVAIKRLLPHFARDPEFVSMFLDEARLAARIHHPNVVQTLDVVAKEGELFLVMEFIEGLSLSGIFWEAVRGGERIPPAIVGAIMTNILAGLHAAHEATNEQGTPLALIHRDVSPQNVLVGRDGVARVLDFGIAKAIGRSHTTREGRIKGKIAYMPPEQIRAQALDRRVDIYAASVMLWELLAMRRLYDEEDDAATIFKSVHEEPPRPSSFVNDLPRGADELVMRGLAKNRDVRYATAREMALAVQQVLGTESAIAVGDFVSRCGRDTLLKISSKVREIESFSGELQLDTGGDERPGVSSRPGAPSSAPAISPASSDAAPLMELPDLTFEGAKTTVSASPRSTAAYGDVRTGASGTAIVDMPPTLPAPRQGSAGNVPTIAGVAPYVGAGPAIDFAAPSHPSASPPGGTPPSGRPASGGWASPPSAPATAPSESSAGGLSVELDLPARTPSRHPALDGRTPTPSYGAPLDPRFSRPAPREPEKSSMPILIGVAALASIGLVGGGLYWWKTRSGPAPDASASPANALTPGGVERSCEVSRKRILSGGDVGTAFDTYGWSIEIWLARDSGPDIDRSSEALTSLRGADGALPDSWGIKLPPEDHPDVSLVDLPAPPWRTGKEPGVVIRLDGGYASKFFDQNGRGQFIALAEKTYAATHASVGALYARCQHLAFHDVGAWFKGADLSLAGDALGFTMAGYAEAPWITRASFEPHGHATTSFEAYQQHRLGVSSEDFVAQLKLLGASVDEEKDSTSIVFPSQPLTRAASASRWLTKQSGL